MVQVHFSVTIIMLYLFVCHEVMVYVVAKDPLRQEDEQQIIRDKLSNISEDALVYRYV